MKRSLIALSACAVLTASLSGCSWFRGGNDSNNINDFQPVDYQTPVAASTTVNPWLNGPNSMPQPTNTGLANIDRINVTRNPVSPEQLIVEISGTIPNGCSQVGAVDYRSIGNTFKYTLPLVGGTGGFCSQAIVPFTKRMGLNAAGRPLAPGTYNIDVNGNVQPFNI